MVDVVLQNVRMLCRINKNEGNESRRDTVTAIFLKYSKQGRSSTNHVGIRNVPSDVCYNDTKHYQVPYEKQGRCKVYKKNS